VLIISHPFGITSPYCHDSGIRIHVKMMVAAFSVNLYQPVMLEKTGNRTRGRSLEFIEESGSTNKKTGEST
jgi:hypothetical protein